MYDEQFGEKYIFYGELLSKGRTGSGHGTPHEKDDFILFDVYDRVNKCFLHYSRVYQMAYDIGIPVTECVMISFINNYDDYLQIREEILGHPTIINEEGAVGKIYRTDGTHVFVKEKHNMPKPPKEFRSKPEDADRPPMLPEDEIINIISTMRDELDTEFLLDVKRAMPELAKRVAEECKKHGYSRPEKKLVSYYNEMIEAIRSENQ